MKKLCGTSNLKKSEELSNKCVIPTVINWTFNEFMVEIINWQNRYNNFNQLVNNNNNDISKLTSTIVYYEDLQMNLEYTMKVFFFI
jgi:hypothetical protein